MRRSHLEGGRRFPNKPPIVVMISHSDSQRASSSGSFVFMFNYVQSMPVRAISVSRSTDSATPSNCWVSSLLILDCEEQAPLGSYDLDLIVSVVKSTLRQEYARNPVTGVMALWPTVDLSQLSRV